MTIRGMVLTKQTTPIATLPRIECVRRDFASFSRFFQIYRDSQLRLGKCTILTIFCDRGA